MKKFNTEFVQRELERETERFDSVMEAMKKNFSYEMTWRSEEAFKLAFKIKHLEWFLKSVEEGNEEDFIKSVERELSRFNAPRSTNLLQMADWVWSQECRQHLLWFFQTASF